MPVTPPRHAAPISADVGVVTFVQASLLCKGIEDGAIDILLRGGLVVEHAPDSVVIQEGGDDQGLFMVFSGSVVLHVDTPDGPVELAVLERPAIFGESAALTEQPRKATATTRADCRFVFFPGVAVRKAAELAPKLGRRLAALMAARDKEINALLGSS